MMAVSGFECMIDVESGETGWWVQFQQGGVRSDVTGASGLSAALQGTGIAMLPGWLDEHYPVSKSIQYYPVPQVCCKIGIPSSTSVGGIPASLTRAQLKTKTIQDPVLLISTARQLWWRNPPTLSMISFSTVCVTPRSLSQPSQPMTCPMPSWQYNMRLQRQGLRQSNWRSVPYPMVPLGCARLCTFWACSWQCSWTTQLPWSLGRIGVNNTRRINYMKSHEMPWHEKKLLNER